MEDDLSRFLIAQENTYHTALQELKNGKKKTHWMWFIFPQIKGLGRSEMAKKYELQNRAEAKRYLSHPVLAERLLKLTAVLTDDVQGKSAHEIFGYPDDLKLKSSLTLFNATVEQYPEVFAADRFLVFRKALKKYFNGERDKSTLDFLSNEYKEV